MRKVAAGALLVCALAGLGVWTFLHRKAADSSGSPPQIAAQESAPQTRPQAGSIAPRTNSAAVVPPSTPAPQAAQLTPAVAAPDISVPAIPVTGPLLFGGPESRPVTIAPETVLENTRAAIRNYGSMFDGNPVGTNPEIAAALNGDNPKGVKFLDPEKGMRLNVKGELVDPWGTPYFFHQLSGTETEIRSAGPDKQMWTADDLVIK